MRTSVRCEGITAAGLQCRCWATQRVNEIPYCDQHAAKVLKEVSGATSAAKRGDAK